MAFYAPGRQGRKRFEKIKTDVVKSDGIDGYIGCRLK